jgi:hypothetical protein
MGIQKKRGIRNRERTHRSFVVRKSEWAEEVEQIVDGLLLTTPTDTGAGSRSGRKPGCDVIRKSADRVIAMAIDLHFRQLIKCVQQRTKRRLFIYYE